jgi:hypothetical protein
MKKTGPGEVALIIRPTIRNRGKSITSRVKETKKLKVLLKSGNLVFSITQRGILDIKKARFTSKVTRLSQILETRGFPPLPHGGFGFFSSR